MGSEIQAFFFFVKEQYDGGKAEHNFQIPFSCNSFLDCVCLLIKGKCTCEVGADFVQYSQIRLLSDFRFCTQINI